MKKHIFRSVLPCVWFRAVTHGRRTLGAGDILHVQYTTTDEAATLREIAEIVE